MTTWQEFSALKPEMAEIGRKLFMLGPGFGGFDGGLAYLATIRKDGGPRIHPISPALLNGRLYAFILKKSPKRHDLLRDGRYALHAFPHPLEKDSFNDEEFCITGRATLIESSELLEAVAKATGDDADGGVVFELSLERALHKGRDKGKLIYTKWKAE